MSICCACARRSFRKQPIYSLREEAVQTLFRNYSGLSVPPDDQQASNHLTLVLCKDCYEVCATFKKFRDKSKICHKTFNSYLLDEDDLMSFDVSTNYQKVQTSEDFNGTNDADDQWYTVINYSKRKNDKLTILSENIIQKLKSKKTLQLINEGDIFQRDECSLKVEKLEFNKLYWCRGCMYEIPYEEMHYSLRDELVRDMFNKCTGLDIYLPLELTSQGDSLPLEICVPCYRNCAEFTKFRHQCHAINKTFKYFVGDLNSTKKQEAEESFDVIQLNKLSEDHSMNVEDSSLKDQNKKENMLVNVMQIPKELDEIINLPDFSFSGQDFLILPFDDYNSEPNQEYESSSFTGDYIILPTLNPTIKNTNSFPRNKYDVLSEDISLSQDDNFINVDYPRRDDLEYTDSRGDDLLKDVQLSTKSENDELLIDNTKNGRTMTNRNENDNGLNEKIVDPDDRFNDSDFVWPLEEDNKKIIMTKKVRKNKYECPECHKKIRIREKRAHFSRWEINSSNSTYYRCDKCKYSTYNKCGFTYHKQTHLNLPDSHIVCHICGKSTHVLGITSHIKTTHEPIVEVTCPVCGKKLTDMQLRGHITKMHRTTTRTKFSCEICKRNVCLSGRRFHMEMHQGIKQHKCMYCDKAFRRKNDLDDHIDVHTDQKRFNCRYCNELMTRMQRRTHEQSCLKNPKRRFVKKKIQKRRSLKLKLLPESVDEDDGDGDGDDKVNEDVVKDQPSNDLNVDEMKLMTESDHEMMKDLVLELDNELKYIDFESLPTFNDDVVRNML